jgi:hypothetical protein
VRVPIKAAIPPAPRAEEFSDGYEEVKADRAADHDSGLRREENRADETRKNDEKNLSQIWARASIFLPFADKRG